MIARYFAVGLVMALATVMGSSSNRLSAQSTPLTKIDLSTYLRIGRFDLPEPTRTSAPAGSVLAQEVSGVTFNWDTNTLFVVGDGGTSVVQVSKTGELVDSMTLAAGSSPQGTEFYDPEGITYVGGGRFVMSEERDCQFVLFTYVPGTTLTRADTRTVKLGTFAPNIGIEGLSYDPSTAGFIAVKETAPQGIFQTGVDFEAGTATNGSPTTENSVDLFDPALADMLDFADVYALSNLPFLSGPDADRLLVLSQESGKIVNIDCSGHVSSSLTIANDPGNPLSVAAQQHEGLTMDSDGFLYIVSENGGGDFDHPQLWVYGPASVPNQAPSSLSLTNQQNTVAENTSTAVRLKVADVVVADDGLGTNNLLVTGPDAGAFEVDSNGLYVRAGTALDFETKSSYAVSVEVNDPGVGANPDATASFALTVTDVVELPPTTPTLVISEVAPWGSGNSPYGADWFEVTNTGAAAVSLAGWRMDDSSNAFASGVTLNGIASIGPGESVIFMETADLATARTSFLATWFAASPPAALQVGSYSGGGVGLSTGGDAVNLFDAGGVARASVSFGQSPTGPFPSFDNAAGLNNAAITQLSVVGVRGAFAAANDAAEIGSPGSTGPAGRLIVSEVAPWSSGNSPVGADWFEVTNVGDAPMAIAGWKVDDSSESPVAAVPLNGITSIAPGESVISIETADLAGAKATFLATWFGVNPPADLQVGSYSGGGIGLSTGGDAVNLYDSAGVLRARVFFAASPAGPTFATFDNAAGLNNAGLTVLSIAGVNGGFVAAGDANEIGSPGGIAADTVPPAIEPHADVFASATGPSGAVVNYSLPVAADNVDHAVVVTCVPPSGGFFPLGATEVTCSASDAALNAAVPVTFTVHVTDTIPPTVTYTGNAGTYRVDQFVAIECVAADGQSGVASTTCESIEGPAWSFPLGVNTFSATATDAAGNVSAPVSTTFTVVVTTPSLQALVSAFSANRGIAIALNAKLAAAANARLPLVRAVHLAGFILHARIESGRALTTEEADTLIRLACGLF